jgi:Flp pilus assembly pilin Flp
MTLFKNIASWLVARMDIRSERGATAVEYAIFVGMIAAVMILAVVFLGNETRKNFRCPSTPRAC